MPNLRNVGVAIAVLSVSLLVLGNGPARAASDPFLGGSGDQAYSFDGNLSASTSDSLFDASSDSGSPADSSSSIDESLFPSDYDYSGTTTDYGWNANFLTGAFFAVGGALIAILDHGGSGSSSDASDLLSGSAVEKNTGHANTPATVPEASSFLSFGALLAGGCLLIVRRRPARVFVA
jgi:hypothetical protein